MKYKNLNLTDDELREESLVKVDNIKPCSECGDNTQYIDYCTESRICSEECMNKQNELLSQICKYESGGMNMSYPVLKNYIITRSFTDNYHISGFIYNDNRFSDNTYVKTSRILKIENHGDSYLFITRNTTYLCHVDDISRDGYYTIQDVIGELS